MVKAADPIERAADKLYAESEERYLGCEGSAEVVIAEYKSWLTEQGIPIKHLLSGEMVAVRAGGVPQKVGDTQSWDVDTERAKRKLLADQESK